MANTLGELRTEGIELSKIQEIRFCHNYGEHAELTLYGLQQNEISMEKFNEIQETTRVSLVADTKEKKRTIFHGLVTHAEMENTGGLFRLIVKAKSLSYCMDIVKKSRTFQDTAMTYHQLIQKVTGEYPQADVKICFQDQPIGSIAVQYQETDWGFLKRMLSLIYQPLSCSADGTNIQIYAGLPDLECLETRLSEAEYVKDMEQFYFWQELGADVQEIDMFVCKAQSDALVNLFEKFMLMDQQFLISAVQIKSIKGVLKSFVKLQRKEGILEKPVYPMHLIGVALEGGVTEVKGSKIRVLLDIDKGDRTTAHYWFPYSTLSASPDGSGWYCMPEIGDRVRINFPSRDTNDAVGISCVSTYQGKDRMGNPATRYLRTRNGQEMSLSSGVKLKNGSSAIRIGDDFNMATSNAIRIRATEKITLNAVGALNLHSSTENSCHGGTGSITLDESGNLLIKGNHLIIG